MLKRDLLVESLEKFETRNKNTSRKKFNEKAKREKIFV